MNKEKQRIVATDCTICHRAVHVRIIDGEKPKEFHKRTDKMLKEIGCTHNGKDYRKRL